MRVLTWDTTFGVVIVVLRIDTRWRCDSLTVNWCYMKIGIEVV